MFLGKLGNTRKGSAKLLQIGIKRVEIVGIVRIKPTTASKNPVAGNTANSTQILRQYLRQTQYLSYFPPLIAPLSMHTTIFSNAEISYLIYLVRTCFLTREV